MNIEKIIAICGVSCTECRAYKATQSGDRSALEGIASEWTSSIGRTFTADDVICDGCRVEGKRLSAYCSSCEIRLCAQSKGLPTCAHCDDCPCDKIVAPVAREALRKLRKDIFPVGSGNCFPEP